MGLEEGAIALHVEAPLGGVALEGQAEPAGQADGLLGRLFRQGGHVDRGGGGAVGVLGKGEDHGPRLKDVEARGV